MKILTATPIYPPNAAMGPGGMSSQPPTGYVYHVIDLNVGESITLPVDVSIAGVTDRGN